MTSSKTETPSDFQFSFFVFIFWTSFQVPIFKSVKKLLQTLGPVKGGFKNLENSKNQRKSDIPAPLQGQDHFYRPSNFRYC